MTPRAQPTAWFVCLHLGFRPKALKPITPHDLCLKKVVDPAHIFLWAAVSTKGNSFASRHRPADFRNYLMYRQLTKKIPSHRNRGFATTGHAQCGWGLARKGAPPALRHHYHSSPLIRSDRHSSLLSKYRRFASTPSHSFLFHKIVSSRNSESEEGRGCSLARWNRACSTNAERSMLTAGRQSLGQTASYL